MKTDSVDRSNYKISTSPSPWSIFFQLFPSFAINELVFGQRVPAEIWVEKNSEKSLNEKTYYPCPHCHMMHTSLKWRHANNTLFGNWFGLYCDHCEKIIPCLRNVFSLIILILTAPIWYWFKDSLKAKWLQVQKAKFSRTLDYTEKEETWWYMGLKWAFETFILVSLIGFIIGYVKFSYEGLFINLIILLIGGLIFGFIMKRYGARNLEL